MIGKVDTPIIRLIILSQAPIPQALVGGGGAVQYPTHCTDKPAHPSNHPTVLLEYNIMVPCMTVHEMMKAGTCN